MYIITSGMSPEEEYLAHYGVLGMKWGHHKAKTYQARGDVVKMKRDKMLEEARLKRAESEEQRSNHNPVTSKRFRKEADELEKSAHKQYDKQIDKWDKKLEKMNDKMNKAFDSDIEKIKNSKKYKEIMSEIDKHMSNKEYRKRAFDNGEYDRYNDDYDADYSKIYAEERKKINTKKLKKDNPNFTDDDIEEYSDMIAMDKAEERMQKVMHDADERAYKRDIKEIDNNIEKLNKSANKMFDKVEKKRKKYIVRTYGVSDQKVEKTKQSEYYSVNFKTKEATRLQEESYNEAMKESSKIESKLKKNNPGMKGKAFDDLLDAAIMDRADQLYLEKQRSLLRK